MVDNIFYIQAIQSLRPGEGFSIDEMDYSTLKFVNDVVKPEQSEIDTKFIEIKNAYLNIEYQRQREKEYPPIGDQLDSLFHAGVFPPEMAAKIQAVKDAYPK